MISISHPTGNEFVKKSLQGLYSSGILHSYFTSIAVFERNIFHKLSKIQGLDAFEKRRINEEFKSFTFTNPSNELARQLCLSLRIESLIKHETGLFSVDSIYSKHDKWFSKSILKNQSSIQGILAYEDASLNSFRTAQKLDIKCFYDLSIGHYKSLNQILEIEKNNYPEWEKSMVGLKNSTQKFERKNEEIELANEIIVASSYTAETLFDHTNKKSIKTIPYGFPDTISVNQIRKRGKSKKFKLLFVGSLTQRKGLATVFKIIENLKHDVELSLIGRKTTNEIPVLNENLKKFRWIESMPHSEILKEMRSHDLLIFPSVFEGFGMVLSEAMSQGLPVLTTNRTMAKDFIKHNFNGLVIEPNDIESALTNIENCIRDEEFRYSLALNALNTAQSRPWANYSFEIAEFIKEQIGGIK
jgi:glycosyltransferase involved in cell wall biosynthesis